MRSNLKVCLVSHLFPCNKQDYKGVFVRDLAVQLTLRGHEVHVVTPMRPGAVKEEIVNNVYIHRFAYLGWRRGSQLGELKGTPLLLLGTLTVMGIFKCTVSVIRHNTDLLHAYWVVPGGFIGLIAGWLTRRPVVATAAGSDLTFAPRNRSVRMLTSLTLKGIDRLLPVSRFLQQLALELGLPRDKATLIHGPVGIDVQDSTQEGVSSSKEYARCLLWLGNLTPPKRADTVIRAMEKIVEVFSDCHLLLVGTGHLRPSLEELTQSLGIENQVHFLGGIPPSQVSPILQIADVLVHCSEYEGLGLAVVEAMGAGLPVVASRVGGIPDLVREGETGFMVSPEDVNGYAEKILALLKNDQLRRQIGANGRRFAVKYLNNEAILSQLEKVYQEVLHLEEKGTLVDTTCDE